MSFWGKARDAIRRIVRGKRAQPAPGVAPPTPDVPKPGRTGGRHRARSVDQLADDLYELGVASGDSHGAVALHDLTNAMGQSGARTVLRNQVQSTRNWMAGNVEPGRTRWFDREEYMRTHSENDIRFDIDVFFWYHAKRKNG